MSISQGPNYLGDDAIAPANWIAPQEPKAGARKAHFAISTRDLFAIGRDQYEFELEAELHVWLDGDEVDVLQPLCKQNLFRFVPVIAGVEATGTVMAAQRELFAKCFETKRGREQLRQLCKVQAETARRCGDDF